MFNFHFSMNISPRYPHNSHFYPPEGSFLGLLHYCRDHLGISGNVESKNEEDESGESKHGYVNAMTIKLPASMLGTILMRTNKLHAYAQ